MGLLHGTDPVIDTADYTVSHMDDWWSTLDDDSRALDVHLAGWTMASVMLDHSRGALGDRIQGSDQVRFLRVTRECYQHNYCRSWMGFPPLGKRWKML